MYWRMMNDVLILTEKPPFKELCKIDRYVTLITWAVVFICVAGSWWYL